jgi:AcrR family transcriptional regulator
MQGKPKSKKQVIYEEAAKLFQEKGYSAASMRDLADRVNLKASSLYSHIRKKEEILQKICFDNAHRFIEGMKEVEALVATPSEKIKALIRLHIHIALEDPTSITVFNDEWRHLEEPFLSRFLNMRKDYEQRFLKIIKEGMEDGELKELNPVTTLFTLITSVRWLHYWHHPERDLQQDVLEKEILTILMTGISA